MEKQGKSLSSTSSMDVRGLAAFNFYSFLNAGLSDCLAARQSGNGPDKNSDAGTSPVPEMKGPSLA
jgi:hypothetical protein